MKRLTIFWLLIACGDCLPVVISKSNNMTPWLVILGVSMFLLTVVVAVLLYCLCCIEPIKKKKSSSDKGVKRESKIGDMGSDIELVHDVDTMSLETQTDRAKTDDKSKLEEAKFFVEKRKKKTKQDRLINSKLGKPQVKD